MEPFHLKKVFVWVPEYIWPGIDFIPCPNCGGRGQPDGWNPAQPRRVFLEEDVGYMIGFRCELDSLHAKFDFFVCPRCSSPWMMSTTINTTAAIHDVL